MIYRRAGRMVEPGASNLVPEASGPFCGEEGQTSVELALFLPMALLLVTGIASFGMSLSNVQVLNSATSIGAKQLAFSRSLTTDPCSLFVSTVTQAAPSLSAANMTFSYQFNNVPYSGTTCGSLSPSSGAAGNLIAGQPLQVTVTYPCSLAAYAFNYGQGCTLSAHFAELVQ